MRILIIFFYVFIHVIPTHSSNGLFNINTKKYDTHHSIIIIIFDHFTLVIYNVLKVPNGHTNSLILQLMEYIFLKGDIPNLK